MRVVTGLDVGTLDWFKEKDESAVEIGHYHLTPQNRRNVDRRTPIWG